MDTRTDEEIRGDLSYLFDKASQALAARMGAALGELGMNVRDYCVLAKAASGERTQGELAELALLDKTTMVVTLDHLEKAGLAQRSPSPVDRRVRIVRTTEAGGAAVAEARGVIDGVYEDVLGVLPDEQRTVLLDALLRLVTHDGPLSAVEPNPHAPRRKRGV
ncbi:MarR family winged helix-turn-helix transcriptional regulator [Pseudonocardia sichuanensis]|uniref:DNA-binding MarR family transcriptional regulator n=1 Tax=Pseudonocardia kunmingensis TaxID=630975 RepID=A0A543DLG2_9PSEU|nr:MarR family winged helix-turn-helix transcriptional regulator [Pseudonocardia kunmingensis]TQM10184.1 DNA-binding MarR family transcriptional regulator [Pseudonocardia kunmingensis]